MTEAPSIYDEEFAALCHPNRDFAKQFLPATLPCRDGVFRLEREYAQGFCEALPHIPVTRTFWIMAAWLAANPARQPYLRNMEAFISRWFSREDANYEDEFINRWYGMCHAS